MSRDFYSELLGLSPGARPPDHFALLGLPRLCRDLKRIEKSARHRLDQLDRFHSSRDAEKREACLELMDEIAEARTVLVDAQSFDDYARSLGMSPSESDSASGELVTISIDRPDRPEASDRLSSFDAIHEEEKIEPLDRLTKAKKRKRASRPDTPSDFTTRLRQSRKRFGEIDDLATAVTSKKGAQSARSRVSSKRGARSASRRPSWALTFGALAFVVAAVAFMIVRLMPTIAPPVDESPSNAANMTATVEPPVATTPPSVKVIQVGRSSAWAEISTVPNTPANPIRLGSLIFPDDQARWGQIHPWLKGLNSVSSPADGTTKSIHVIRGGMVLFAISESSLTKRIDDRDMRTWFADQGWRQVADPAYAISAGTATGKWVFMGRHLKSGAIFEIRNNEYTRPVIIARIASEQPGSSEPTPGGESDQNPTPTTASKIPRKIGDTVNNSIGMKLAYIPAGEFVMGSPASEEGRQRSETQHRVKLSKPYYLGVTEVTQGQWKSVMGTAPSHFKGEDLPVEMVSWSDAVKFCEVLSKTEGRRYRLPTEAEWEYACRAGTTGAYAGTGNLNEMGWHRLNSSTHPHIPSMDRQTHRVGLKKANAWGLYDMHGNVWEWCSGWSGDHPAGEGASPKQIARLEGTGGITRGGSWNHPPKLCRSAYRVWLSDSPVYNVVGFRIVLDPHTGSTDADLKPVLTDSTRPTQGIDRDSPTIEFVKINPGTFVMGSPPDEKGHSYDETLHQVQITYAFEISDTEITQLQYETIMGGSNPSRFTKDNLGGPDHPVERVTWENAMEYCRRLSARDGQHYRLPTEAEWEYACRAGTSTRFNLGDEMGDLSRAGWHVEHPEFDTSEMKPMSRPVGLLKPNAWGLYDMHGNVAEWCHDFYSGKVSSEGTVDPVGHAQGPLRVTKGGSWLDGPSLCRSGSRRPMAGATEAIGFRVVRGPKLAAPKPAIEKQSISIVGDAQGFVPMKPDQVTADRATIEIADDSSVLVKTKAVKNIYKIRFKTRRKSISTFRLEALLDDTFPNRGPGIGAQGRIAIAEVRLQIASAETPDKWSRVALINAEASSSDLKYPIGLAFDGNPRTHWVPSQTGRSQQITFQTEKSLEISGLSLLEFEIEQRLAIGKFRISAISGDGPTAPAPKTSVVSTPLEKAVFTNSFGMKFARIPAGDFVMGSPEGEIGRSNSEVQHRVKLTRSFLMCTTEVTQAQWKAVMRTKPSVFKGDDLPVDHVSWDDAIKFCETLSKREGKRYRLPTEAEWEYACRAGTTGSYGGTGILDEIGWYGAYSKGNSSKTTNRVGQKRANAWGLYDMHGNIGEWCSDSYGDYAATKVTDPKGPKTKVLRVVRGGSWYDDAASCRSAARSRIGATERNRIVGIRVVLDLQ